MRSRGGRRLGVQGQTFPHRKFNLGYTRLCFYLLYLKKMFIFSCYWCKLYILELSVRKFAWVCFFPSMNILLLHVLPVSSCISQIQLNCLSAHSAVSTLPVLATLDHGLPTPDFPAWLAGLFEADHVLSAIHGCVFSTWKRSVFGWMNGWADAWKNE